MATQPLALFALNDFAHKAKLKAINPTTGAVGPLTSGTVTAFLSTSKTATAVAADASLSVTAVFLGVVSDSGVWLIFIDGAVLTPTLLDAHFNATTPPYLIVQQPGNIRGYAPVTYASERPLLVG